ncbi:hypothetical protein [Duganella sp.]|uniref:hypothetical protein n=1 Tax=Duganella sp. TaxID=1904440 RepID=UPI0031D3F3EC
MTASKNPSYDELLASIARRRKEWADQQLAEHAEQITAFIDFAKAKGVKLDLADVSYIEKIGFVANGPNLLARLAGPLQRERDGLLSFDAFPISYIFDAPDPGYFQAEDFLPMAHPHFRRGMYGENHFAPRFVEMFWALPPGGVQKFLALDEERVKLNINTGQTFERDTWFGAPFNDDIASIPNGMVKLRPPADLDAGSIDMFFGDAYCLDMKWNEKDGIKTFQALEVKSERTRITWEGEMVFPARYIHAEFDISKGEFRHFDGAVQYYGEQEYLLRRDSDFNYNVKNREQIKARSKKLFKLNGQISIATWGDLCSQFLAGNPLIFEYFAGSYPSYLVEIIEKLRARDARNAPEVG